MASYHFAVLGDPIEHSRSPELHSAMLDIAGLTGDYARVRADEQGLAKAVDDLRAGKWDGLNVTMPLKAAAARVADTLSPHADRSGSVNTLLMKGASVYGDSTDSVAFGDLVGSSRFSSARSTLLLGAGDSAAAALAAIVPGRDDVYVSSRRISQAENLVARLGGEAVPWGTAVAGTLVINTTPLGMDGETLPRGVLEVAAGLIDLPYGVGATPAVTAARLVGIPCVDGHEFLLRQAIASFALWTEVEIAAETLRDALRKD